MPKLQFNDPIGPGTPAWDAFDRAVEAYKRVPRGEHNKSNADYRRYANQRDYMIMLLRKHNLDESGIATWLNSLNNACTFDWEC
jgi:hypothetical protein